MSYSAPDRDGFLMRDNSENKSIYYITEFEVHDPVVLLRTREKDVLLVSPLEAGRARNEASVDEVVSTSKYEDGDSRDNKDKQVDILKSFLKDYRVDSLDVPEDFPLLFADKLREDIEVRPVEDPVMEERKVKSSEELEKMREVQRLTEESMEHAKNIIKQAEVDGEALVYQGEELTSDRLRGLIKKFLEDRGCEVPEKSIVVSGSDGADPHSIGEGPLKHGEPIIIDIFPRKNGYFGDMTRTFVKGEASKEFRDMYDAVNEALEVALDHLEAGVTAEKVHGKVCDVLEEHGFETLRSDNDTEEGFIHSTGHAVGLELHEPPRVADSSDELRENMVLTIEPGLYYEDVGGVRIEEMIRVTEDGFENLNSMDRDFCA